MKKTTFPITTKKHSGLLLVNKEKDIIESAVQMPTTLEKFKYYWGGLGWVLFKTVYDVTTMPFDLPNLDVTDGPVEKLVIALNSKSEFFTLKSKPYKTLSEQEKFTLTLFENLYRDYHFEDHTGIETFADFNANPLYVIDIILSDMDIQNNETIRFALDSFVYEVTIVNVQDNLSVQMKCMGVVNDTYSGIVSLSNIAKSSFLIKQPEQGITTMGDILDFETIDDQANNESSQIMVTKQMEQMGEGTIGALAPGMSIKEIFQKVNTSLKIDEAIKSEPQQPKPQPKPTATDWGDIF